MKKLSRIVVLCLTLILAFGMTFVLTACDETSSTSTTDVTTPTYKVNFVLNDLEGNAVKTVSVSVKENRTVAVAEGTSFGIDDVAFAGYTYNDEEKKSFKWYTSAEYTEEFDFNTAIKANTTLYAKLSSNGKETNADISKNASLVEKTIDVKYYEDSTAKTKAVSLGEWDYIYSNSSAAIPNDEYVFDFNKKFENVCAGAKATFKVYSDEACTYIAGDDASKSQIVTLSNGDNYYYLKIFAEDTRLTKVYKINLYLEPKYTVTVQSIMGNPTTKVKSLVSVGASLEEPNISGINPGYTKEGWFYNTKEKRNEYGQIVDENGDVLVLENGVYYAADKNGNKRFVYMDASGNKAVRDGDVYYKADKNGNKIQENGAYVALSDDELFNVLEDGLPTYEVGYPITGKGSYLNVWDFSKCKVTENYMHIFARWTQDTYKVTLKFLDTDIGARFGGKNISETSISFTVNYNTSAAALADAIKSATAGVDPIKDYASFDGWYYGDARMVGANSQSVSAYTIVGPATFYAHFNDNAYTVNVVANDTTMAKTVTGAGTTYKYGDIISLGAAANEGYELIGWSKNGVAWTDYGTDGSLDNPKYPLNIADIKDGAVTFKAIFAPKTYAITFVDGNVIGTEDDNVVKTINVEYNTAVTLGEKGIPEYGRVSETGDKLFVGWYYLDANNQKQYIVTFKNNENVISSTFANWTFTADTKVYADWKNYEFTLSAYQAMLINTTMGYISGKNASTGATYDKWTDLDELTVGQYKLTGKMNVASNSNTIDLEAITGDKYYKFLGWYAIDLTDENPFDFDNLTPFVGDDGETLLTAISATINEADLVYVALWTYKDVTVKFDATTIKTALDDVTVKFGTADYALPIGDINNDELEFVGWFDDQGAQYTSADGKALRSFTNKDYIENGITLSAKFQDINYFNVESGLITGLSEKGAEKVKNGKNELTINIDDEITGIKQDAFNGNTTIKSITIQGNIQNIGVDAFANSKIEKVIFKGEFKGLSVERGAFSNCVNLTSISFPANTISLASGVLDGSYSLKELGYGADDVLGELFTTENPYDDNSWYPAEQGFTTYYIPKSLKTVNVVSKSNKVADYAFENCVYIEKVVLGDNTTIIGNYAFATVNTTVTDIADISVDLKNVETIGNYAFYNSTISSVDFSALKTLGVASFKNAKSLTSVLFAKLNTVSNSAFEGCTKLTTVTLSNVKHINAYAFMNSGVATLGGAATVESLGEKCFYGCEDLGGTAVTSLSAVSDIAAYALDKTAYFPDRENAAGTFAVNSVLYYTTLNSVADNIQKIAPYAMTKVSGGLTFNSTSTLKYIDSSAFANNTTLTSITLPESLLAIRDNAFSNATALQSVDMSNCFVLASIGRKAFENCGALTSVTFPTFDTDDTTKAKFNATKLSIYDYAFSGCNANGFTTITLPDNLGYLGSYAFYNCSKLQTVNFVQNEKLESVTDPEDPDTTTPATYASTTGLITAINPYTFYGCTSLSSISLPKFIKSIGESAFENDSALTSITLLATSSAETTSLTSIGAKAFKNCVLLSSVDDNSTKKVSSIGESAFENDINLSTITISISLSSISDRAFKNCAKLTTINGCSTRISIGNEAFKNCKVLTKLTASNASATVSYANVGDSAFENCIMVSEISFSATEYIGANAFNGCYLIEKIAIPSTTATIGDSAFAGCRSAMFITFEEGVAEIGVGAFANCSAVASIVLPESVVVIYENAFDGCTGLKSVTINAGIEYIGADAFANTDGLEIKFLGTDVPYITDDILTGATNYTIYVPEGYVNSFETADVWSKYAGHYKTYSVEE